MNNKQPSKRDSRAIGRRVITLFIMLSLIFVSACGDRSKKDSETYTVGTWKTAQTIQPFFYQDYLPEGASFEVLPFTNPGDQKTALLAGELDMCGTTWVTAITAASKGEPVKVVAGMTEKCSALVTKSGDEINQVADLKGKVIAYVPGTMHHILLLETLQKNGLDVDQDVTLLQIDFFDMGAALADGQIDAFCSGEPYPSIAVLEGYGKILEYPYYDDSVGFINAGMLTTDTQIADHPERVQALVDAHIEATKYLMEHSDIWLERAAEFGTEQAVLEQALDNMELVWDITPETIQQVKNLAQRMYELDIISTVPDIDELIDLQFLPAGK
ncbi:MAG: ABC transporter substrate-binding protein [Fastidiosipilaceae bacterium]|jgi:NitT/TauT family transport system substrate-binding protein